MLKQWVRGWEACQGSSRRQRGLCGQSPCQLLISVYSQHLCECCQPIGWKLLGVQLHSCLGCLSVYDRGWSLKPLDFLGWSNIIFPCILTSEQHSVVGTQGACSSGADSAETPGWQSCKTEQDAAMRRVLAPNYLLKIIQNCYSPKVIQHARIVWIGMWFGLTGQEATEVFVRTSIL